MAEETQPYTSYNKQDEVPTLIGNWVEERELKELTGVTRNLAASQALKDTSDGTSPTRSLGDALTATHPRVIEHVQAQTHAADWQSTVQATYRPPSDATRNAAAYVNTSKMGPRERMLHEQLMREAQDLPPELQATLTGPAVPVTTASTYGADFHQHDLTGIVVGAKVMKDRDGRPAVRDPTFLAETQMMKKDAADRLMGETARQSGARDTTMLPNPDVPVTIYTEAVANKTYGGVFPGTTTLNTAAPFGKSTNFSKPMSDYSKVVVDE
ncbi:hypothetical protein CHLRE_02g095149v5 [Chlamydomonas reinhardtii]|uniref:Uncharacterized protein n=1 Tax=Chlamydomonas reinhardtii TaxID=3055 RepID=A0A2K3E1X6_CHLRE|nr:uncharacterized protein CHLRE_02g095149v5 [Chlamydomonas reinhardtii]6U42_6E Chain 6E, FAP143 [Chlamydomonas reinhardtii]8GLV_6E Chain 6E, FAP143 [Chlamydomonas reinhardtii]8GLV_HN Chain HN, FAP143 [Chlamydomonas reinhardtii]8GLV_Om Chain Om, FAP143 [Chlamydomonas reinhardtii]PNW86767.1 hypothetical protein CHLRE_02g095149v5 [Chlamydomonas reinhardtii]